MHTQLPCVLYIYALRPILHLGKLVAEMRWLSHSYLNFLWMPAVCVCVCVVEAEQWLGHGRVLTCWATSLLPSAGTTG